jgi:hypothetical protein
MTEKNQAESKQVDNAQNLKDDGAVSYSDNNNTDTATDTPNGKRIPGKISLANTNSGPPTDPAGG